MREEHSSFDEPRRSGMDIAVATRHVQRDNDRVIGLIRHLLPASTFTPDDDVLAVESPLDHR
jgi:hypothetical protein